MHLDKKHWVWIGVAVAGVVGLYLLSHRGTGSAPAGSGLPATGPPQLGNMTPAAAGSSSFDQGQMVAASLSDRYHQMAQMNADNQLSLTEQHFGVSAALPGPAGAISKGWQQIQGGWADLAHPGHNISEQEAVALGPQNHGPYAKGGGGFFGTLLRGIGSNIQQGLQIYAASQGVPLGGGGQPYTPGVSPGPYAPGEAPRTPNAPGYGNSPVPVNVNVRF